uniref:Mg-protoporphyrin IX methyl transferase n=1 Tax=Paulinella chromatophora TaxID=39717 RepID=B1X4A2_PAUCH|nr:Mg-protoporphyrin IX methyl transferase [Paulinella chromatophora]ACB42771.1 Mg-protoporphyrin IX methyl transferase [Paulinella chromatophora]
MPENQSIKSVNDQRTSLKKVEKIEVTNYFNNTGFDRWKRIYSDSSDVNKVQRNIRIGHKQMVDQVLIWLQDRGGTENESVCDAGCGVGSLTLPLAQLGAKSITASDISEAMVEEVQRRARAADIDVSRVNFNASDLENINNTFDTTICLDVFMHYQQQQAEEMVRSLSHKTKRRLIVSFSPYNPLLGILKAIGQFFPGSSKTTRAYLLRERGIIAAAEECGLHLVRKSLQKAPFYFSQLIEFERI